METIFAYTMITVLACTINIVGVLDSSYPIKYTMLSNVPLLLVLVSSLILFKTHLNVHKYWSVFLKT